MNYANMMYVLYMYVFLCSNKHFTVKHFYALDYTEQDFSDSCIINNSFPAIQEVQVQQNQTTKNTKGLLLSDTFYFF